MVFYPWVAQALFAAAECMCSFCCLISLQMFTKSQHLKTEISYSVNLCHFQPGQANVKYVNNMFILK